MLNYGINIFSVFRHPHRHRGVAESNFVQEFILQILSHGSLIQILFLGMASICMISVPSRSYRKCS